MPRNLTGTPGVREDTPRLSPDGKRVAYFSDATGEYQLYVRDVATGETTQVTTDLDRKVYHPRWSPDGKKILFGDKDFALHVVDLATKKRTKIDESRYLDNDEFTWEVSDYAWSPDSRWVAYSLPRENRNNAIFLYDTVEGRKVQLTDDFYENLNPRFDADGGYLYFLSYRNYQIGMDPFEDNHIVANPARVMVAQLRKGEKPPFVKRPATEPAPAPADERPERTPPASGWTSTASPRASTRCRWSPGTTSTSWPARATSRGPRSRSSPRTSTRRSTAPGARPSGRSTSSR